MDFNQGEFDLSGSGSDDGFVKWRQDLDEKKRAFEVRYGIVVGRRVRVQLMGELNELEGMIHLVSPKSRKSTGQIRLSLGNREFSPREIERIVRVTDDLPQ